MAKRKAPSLDLADFTPGERVDAMKPNDTPVTSRKTTEHPVHKAGISEPIRRTDIQ